MAILSCRLFSAVLKHNIEITVIIPTPEGNEQITDTNVRKQYHYAEGLPVVYLLHGAYGDCASWTRNSNIDRYIHQYNCVAVMASVENSFYQDMAHGNQYYTFMCEELPEYVRNLFPVSRKREDTYIAGFSMGGYGAWLLGLRRPDQYCKAASMSGALDVAALIKAGEAALPQDNLVVWSDIFQDAHAIEGSDSDLIALYEKDQKNGVLPELYQSCGTADSLIEMNRSVHQKMTDIGAAVSYHEAEGKMHNWDYWDAEIQNVLKWMFPSK